MRFCVCVWLHVTMYLHMWPKTTLLIPVSHRDAKRLNTPAGINQRLQVWFLVRAHVWVVGSVPGWGTTRDNQSMFLFLSLSFPSPLSKINKHFQGKKLKENLSCLINIKMKMLSGQLHVSAEFRIEVWCRCRNLGVINILACSLSDPWDWVR